VQKVTCPQPSRKRHDERVVEVFLHTYKQGCFAKDPCWLPQNRRNVEVIATSTVGGSRLAIEHTRVFAFDGHMEQEAILRPLAERIEAIRLPGLSNKWVQIYFQSNFMSRPLRKNSELVQDEIIKFLERTLPTITPNEHHVNSFNIPIPLPNGRHPTITVDVEVWGNMDVKRPISVSGILPQGPRLETQVTHALQTKLQKLVDAVADTRFLMIEIATHTESEIAVAKVIRRIQGEFPLLIKIDQVVFAKAFGFDSEGCIFFRMWNPQSEEWALNVLNARIEKSNNS
jgi:hypothetical protein